MEEECHQLDLKLAAHIAPQQIDRDTFSQYSTAIKERSQLQEKKAELESYTTALWAGIAQIAVHVQETENNSLLLALEQEYRSASQKMKDIVSYFVSLMESITLKYNYIKFVHRKFRLLA